MTYFFMTPKPFMHHRKVYEKISVLHAVSMLFVLIQIILYLVKHSNTDKNSLESCSLTFVFNVLSLAKVEVEEVEVSAEISRVFVKIGCLQEFALIMRGLIYLFVILSNAHET